MRELDGHLECDRKVFVDAGVYVLNKTDYSDLQCLSFVYNVISMSTEQVFTAFSFVGLLIEVLYS